LDAAAPRGDSAARERACPYDHRMARTEDDPALVAAARGGDVDAFAELVRRHERRLRLVLLRILDDARDVEEAVQDAFVLAWRNLDRYRGEAAVFTWLYRIGVNEALQRRRKRRLPTADIETAGPLADERRDTQPHAAAEAAAARREIAEALAALPLEYREAVVLRDLAGLSNDEVAAALGLSLPATKSRIHRGRSQLRALLEPWVRG
jgi:RNA polymerase sigma-70 factor (ECF subfamily)